MTPLLALLTVAVLLDPWLAILDEAGLSFSGTYAADEAVAKLKPLAQCAEPTPGATSCRRIERYGDTEASVVVTVAQGQTESFIESVNVAFDDAPEEIVDATRAYFDSRYGKPSRGESDWCGGHHVVSLGSGDGRMTMFYWNIFKRETSICRDGQVVKLIPFVIPGGRSKPPVFLGLGNEIDWGILPPDLNDADADYDRWVFETAKGKGLRARKDLMLRRAEVTYFFNTIAGSLSEVQIRFPNLSRPFKDRLIDQLKDVFRYHASFELENGAVRRGRMCKEDLHLLVGDGPKGFVISMYHNPDGFCVD
ncbi:MAG: hypothetical protein HY897_24425 [Deltaproteobacteria bacterium]|nr:hypothetical protein [Deltaproteobacteria bacterium]